MRAVCGHPFASPIAAQSATSLCRLCRTGFYPFDRARSYAVYSNARFEAIILMKYEEITSLGRWFAERLVEIDDFSGEPWRPHVVVPVPLHPERKRERGYNQAELVAGPLPRLVGFRLKPDLLIRRKGPPPAVTAFAKRTLEIGRWRLRYPRGPQS